MHCQCKQTIPKPGDRIDNDCDGKVDEERRDRKDNDKDGTIDEDIKKVSQLKKFLGHSFNFLFLSVYMRGQKNFAYFCFCVLF